MTDFELMDEAFDDFFNDTDDKKHNEKCTHDEVVDDGGTTICVNCGEEIKITIAHEKEWRYYGNADTRRTNDPNRVQVRKEEDRNIYKDVEGMGISEKIITTANSLYCDSTKDHIYRGKSRRSIIFGAVYLAFKLDGNPQSHERLISLFNITKKAALNGIKFIKLNVPKDSKIHTSYITPIHLINDIMDRFSISKEQKEVQKKDVIELYDIIKNKSSTLKRSRPKSVTCGLIFYLIQKNKIRITLKEFANKSGLSELTINKISKEIVKTINKLSKELIKTFDKIDL